MVQRLLVTTLLLSFALTAQRRVDPRNTYHRVICVVPLVGSGSSGSDPKRPEYAPWPISPPVLQTNQAATPNNPPHPGIVAFSYVTSDDGKYAIVEFVAYSRSAFQAILADHTIPVFEKGTASKATIEAAVQKYRKAFSLDQFGTVMP